MPEASHRAVATVGLSSAAAFALFMRRYILQEVGPPTLVHGEKEPRELLLQVRALLRDYRPHPLWEFSGLLSTMFIGPQMVLPDLDATLGGRLTAWGFLSGPGRTEQLKLADGGTVSLEWGAEPMASEDAALPCRAVLLLPGLNNSSRTPYIQAAMLHLQRSGFYVAALNYRGIAGTPLTTQRVGCADAWRDLPEVTAHMEACLPGVEMFAIGYSMGGGILLRHLGEEGERSRISAAATIAAPVDFPAVVKRLESTWSWRLFNLAITIGAVFHSVKSLKEYPEYKAKVDVARLFRSKSIREVDEFVICPLNGYSDPEDYYANCSPLPVLQRIAVRTLIMHAEDDPVVGFSTVPLNEIRKNPNLLAAVTRRGGHLAWTGSAKANGASWVERVAANFFKTQSKSSRASQQLDSKL